MTCGTVYFRQRKNSRQRSWKSSPKQTRSSKAGAPSSSRPPVNSSQTKRCAAFMMAQQRREQAKVGIPAHLVPVFHLSYPDRAPEQKFGKVGQKIDLPAAQPVMMAAPPPPGTPAAALYAAAQAQAQAQLRAQAQSQSPAQQSLPMVSPIPTTLGKPANGLAPLTSGAAESATSDGEANTPQTSSKSVSQPQLILPFISRKQSSAEKEQEAEVADVHISDTYGIHSNTYHVALAYKHVRAPRGACKLSRKKYNA